MIPSGFHTYMFELVWTSSCKHEMQKLPGQLCDMSRLLKTTVHAMAPLPVSFKTRTSHLSEHPSCVEKRPRVHVNHKELVPRVLHLFRILCRALHKHSVWPVCQTMFTNFISRWFQRCCVCALVLATHSRSTGHTVNSVYLLSVLDCFGTNREFHA